MFFVASKILGFLLTPSNAVVLLGLAGIALLALHRRRSGVACVVTSIIALAVLGWTPAATWLLLPLTERFPNWQGASAPDAIVVLGGAIDSDASLARGQIETDAAGERIIAMLQLARRFPQTPIVYSGGANKLLSDSAAEAPIAGRLLADFGLANGRVLLENESRTTGENAAFTARLLDRRPDARVLLVTSAWHMPRAIGLYRKAGLNVEAYPVDFRTRGWSDGASTFDRASYGVARADVAVHEWLGLLAAWSSGKSGELFPGPR